MQIIDFITILVFSIGVVAMGLVFSRKGSNVKSFFAGSGAVPWQMSGLSLFMGFFSAGTFVVWGSIAYRMGMVSVAIQWTMAIAGFIVGAFIAPRWRKTGALTAAEYITRRLGGGTQKTYTWLFLFVSLFTTAAFLYPVAKIIEVATGLPLSLCILLIGGGCVLYVSLGGIWAVMSTDVLQFVILTAVVIILVLLSAGNIGTVAEFTEKLPDTFMNLTNEEYSPGFLLAFGCYNAIFLGGNWAYVQRYTTVETSKDASKVGYLFGCLYIICPVLWMAAPMIYRTIEPGLSDMESEGAYLLMCKEILPPGVMGLMLAGMIFATASSMNATLNISSGVITNDLYKRWKPESSERTLMNVARLSTLCIGIISIIIALMIQNMGGIVNVVISLAALTGAPLYLPVIWSLFSKRQTGLSILTATVSGLIVNIIFKFVIPAFGGGALSRSNEMILGVFFSAAVLIGFEIYYAIRRKTAPLYPDYVRWETANAEAYASITAEDKHNMVLQNKFSIRVIGFSVLFAGLAVACLSFVSANAFPIIFSTGFALVITGIILILKNRQR